MKIADDISCVNTRQVLSILAYMPTYDSPRQLPTASVLDELRIALDEAADQRDLSQRKRQIYGTWIFGFVCWCLRNPPHRVTTDRIEAFRRNLRDDSSADPIDQQRALDALAFFFGAVNVHDLGVRTSRPDPSHSHADLPFVYYNQMSSPNVSPLSPVREPEDDVRAKPNDLSSPESPPDLESPERT